MISLDASGFEPAFGEQYANKRVTWQGDGGRVVRDIFACAVWLWSCPYRGVVRCPGWTLGAGGRLGTGDHVGDIRRRRDQRRPPQSCDYHCIRIVGQPSLVSRRLFDYFAGWGTVAIPGLAEPGWLTVHILAPIAAPLLEEDFSKGYLTRHTIRRNDRIENK